MQFHNSYQAGVPSTSVWVSILFILVLITAFNLGPFLAATLFLVIAFIIAKISIQKSLLTPVQLVVFAYVLAFPTVILLPDYIQYSERFAPPPEALAKGMLWALRGFAMFALGYALINQRKGVKQDPTRVRSNSFFSQRTAHAIYITKWLGILAGVGWTILVVMKGGITMPGVTAHLGKTVPTNIETSTVEQILNLLTNLRYPFFSMFLILKYYKQTNRSLTLLFSFLLTVSIIEFMVSGSKGDLIRILVSVFLAISLLPVRIGVGKILLALATLVIISTTFSVVTEYRSIMDKEFKRRAAISSFSVQLSSFQLAFSRTLGLSDSDKLQTDVSSEDIASRFAAPMFSFTNLLRFTNGQSPYEYAWQSFLVPLYSILPRALAPGKPTFFNSGRNAQEYYGWVRGGVSVSMPGSLFFAWGYAGILFGMFFLGCLLAYVMKYVNRQDINSVYWTIILMTLVMQLIATGVTFQSATTNVIRVILLVWLLHVLYSKVQRRKQQRKKLQFTISNSRSARV